MLTDFAKPISGDEGLICRVKATDIAAEPKALLCSRIVTPEAAIRMIDNARL